MRRRGARRAAPTVVRHSWSIPVTAVGDGLEHEVGDQAVAGAREAGQFHTLCGELIAPVALTESPGRPCPACSVELNPLPELSAADTDAQRRALTTWLHDLTARTNRGVVREAVGAHAA